MKKSCILILALMFVLPTVLDAQRGQDPKKEKQSDLSAQSIKARWKDAKTLEITAAIKNVSDVAFNGSRIVTLKMITKDGKTEAALEQAVPNLAGGESHSIKFETTDAKFFEKERKWVLEISAGDPTAANDKKTVTLTLPTQPKG